MSLTNEQILAAHKANMETLFGLTTKAFEGVEKLVELNLTASRAALNEAASHTQAVLSVKDVQELMALQAACCSLWLKRPPPTAATCTTSPRAPAPNSARLPKPRPAKPKELRQHGGRRCQERPRWLRNRRRRDEERRVRRQQCF
jgi:hypothetical protein